MKLRVLIVDDSLTVRMDLQEAFENAGFEVTSCSNLQEARSALSSDSFEIVILDVLLPDGDGVEFLAELKSSSRTAAFAGHAFVDGSASAGSRTRAQDGRGRLRGKTLRLRPT